MASQFDAIRNRKKQGDDARQRVLNRVYSPSIEAAPSASGSAFEAVRNRKVEPIQTGTPMAELQQSFGDITPLNLIGSAQFRGQQVKQERSTREAEEATKPKTTGQRIMGAVNGIGQFLTDFPGAFTDSATFGLSDFAGRAIGGETKEQQQERDQRAGGKVGGFAGYLMPGSAIESGVALASRPLIQNLPRVGQLATTGAAAGIIEGAAQEAGDVAFRQESFDPENILIGGALGGGLSAGLGMAVPVIQRSLANRQVGNALMRGIENTELPLNPGGLRPQAELPTTPRLNAPDPAPTALPDFDPNAAPILRPGQFDQQSGLGITPFSRTNPYDSLRTDTQSQLVSRQTKEPAGIANRTEKLYTTLVDDLHPLNKQDKILEEIMGGSLPASQRTHDLGLASRGADVVAKRIITDGLVDSAGRVVTDANGQAVGSLKDILNPLRPLMRRKKDIYVDFEDYLINKHAPTRYERGEKVFRDDLGWTPQYGAQKVAEYEQMFPQFKEMSDRLYTFQREMAQKWLVDTGMIPQEMLDAWVQQNPFYVPNKRYFSELEKTGKGVGGSKKKGYGNQSNPVKGYQEGGSQRRIISPIESIIENVDAYVKSAKRNQVMQQYVRNIEQHPKAFEPWATVVKQPEKVDDIAKIVMDEGGIDELLFRFSADFDKAMQRTQLDKDNIVRALIDGQPVHVQIKDKDLLAALTALGPDQSNIVMKWIGNLTNNMKLLTTGSNPVFTFTRNLMRDIPQAYIASKTRDNPISFVTDLFSAAVDIGRKRGAYKEFLNIGGGHASPIAADRNLLAQSKRRILPQSGIRPGLARLQDGYENFLNTVEIAPRLAEFKRAKQQTGDIQEALKAAQDITVNFKRKGSAVKELDRIFPYMNAAIQGMDKTLRTYRDDPVKALVKTALAITLPTLALYAVNHDDPNYQQLSNRTKDAFLLIPRGDGTFIKIAKPQEQGTIFSDIPERLMRLLAEEDPAAFRDFADRLRTTLLPPGIQGAAKGGGLTDSLLGVVGDTILGPVADIAANETFSGAPIVPGNLERLSPGLQADAKTTNIARWIGEQTLGTPFEQSPKELDYLVRQYSGFLGQFGQPLLSPGGDVGYALSQQMTADPVFSNDLSTEFYNYKDKLDQAYADRALRDLPEWYSDPLRKRLNKISTNMSAVRKEIREVQGDEDISNADKRAKLRELQERINRMAEMGNGLARDRIPY